MHFKTKCNICGHEYDATEPKCPYCDEPNTSNMDAVKNPNVAVLPWWKQLVLFLVGWLGFQIIATILGIIFSSFNLKEIVLEAVMNFGGYTLLVTAMGLVTWVDWKKLFKSFKGWKPFVFGLAGFGAIMLFSRFWSIICTLADLHVTDNANQDAATKLVKGYPFFSILILGLIGPLCEELTYRVGLFSFTKRVNKILAYIISIIAFALIHFKFAAITSSIDTGNWDNLFNELLNLPFYFFAGFTFTFLYEKFGLAGSLTAHVTNNVYSVIMTLLLPYIQKLTGE